MISCDKCFWALKPTKREVYICKNRYACIGRLHAGDFECSCGLEKENGELLQALKRMDNVPKDGSSAKKYIKWMQKNAEIITAIEACQKYEKLPFYMYLDRVLDEYMAMKKMTER